jgi:ABC-type Co2+ transport system permease subunit
MLLAVHISDQVLAAPWWLGGFALAALLVYLGSRDVQDDEVPRIALLTAAFFIASSIHVRLPPTSVHLILGGLVGVLLGWRACLAIPVGLFLQMLLLNHGGFTTLGVNTCVIAVPALFCCYLFHALHRVPWRRRAWFRSVLVAFSGLLWTQSLVYSVTLLCTNTLGTMDLNISDANAVLLAPWSWAVTAIVTVVLVVVERRLETTPEFCVGLLIGELAVLLTLGLNCAVLIAGGAFMKDPAVISLVAHLPIAVVEGLVLGFAVGFLAKVKPAMLGETRRFQAPETRPPATLPTGPIPN